ncbi:hypothetical protein RF11_09582 [Thelohanellus kitauei]|uniref:Uncharacterized protein n=1 Tax=Thelohanellus kitauei TaxID=669202 RepID=A0A0C2M5C9_THEKT|nr:hypothetical protein RF11_09582 [Thelohanellus kitauei]
MRGLMSIFTSPGATPQHSKNVAVQYAAPHILLTVIYGRHNLGEPSPERNGAISKLEPAGCIHRDIPIDPEIILSIIEKQFEWSAQGLQGIAHFFYKKCRSFTARVASYLTV